MSTFLVSLAVVGTAVICIVAIALSDADQPATVRLRGRRGPRRSRTEPAALHIGEAERGWAVEGSGIAAPVVADVSSALASPPMRRGDRLRSSLALVVLVTFVGTLVALAIGAAVTLGAAALKDAVG